MKALVLTHVGLEKISAEEIKHLISAKNIETKPGRVYFECATAQDLVDLTYFGRTFSKVVHVLGAHTGQPDTSAVDVKEFLDERVLVKCNRTGEHAFTSQDIAEEFNDWLRQEYGVTIDRKNPQTIIFIDIVDDAYTLGIDYSGIDLGKRDYRIFLGTNSLKGNIAAGVLFFAEYEGKHILLDPFCRHGIIPIEAALYARNMSPHRFSKEKLAFANLPHLNYDLKDNEKAFEGTIIAMDDNFKHVMASKKNAKIAAVNKDINFSRTDMKWLDAKYGKHAIDRIIALPRQPSKTVPQKVIEKVFHEFFYQADFILKKDGKVCLVMKQGMDMVKSKAKEFGFSVEKEMAVMQGKEGLNMLLFSR